MGSESVMKLKDFTNDQLLNCATRLLAELKEREVVCGPLLRDVLLTPSQEEQELVKGGKFIEAIKHHRIRTGAGLKESKDIMDVYRAVIGPYTSAPIGTSAIRLTSRDHQRIQDGEYLEIIKDIRRRFSSSLVDAKAAVDAYRNGVVGVPTNIQLDPHEHRLIDAGDYYGAVKAIRTRTMASFPEAKWLVDDYRYRKHMTEHSW